MKQYFFYISLSKSVRAEYWVYDCKSLKQAKMELRKQGITPYRFKHKIFNFKK